MVSTTLEWLLLLTASQPLVQERARSDALCAGSGYVGALTKEVLRAKPPLLLPRTATVETSLRGFRVPRGCVVYANNWALAHSEARGAERGAARSREEPRGAEIAERSRPPCPLLLCLSLCLCSGRRATRRRLSRDLADA